MTRRPVTNPEAPPCPSSYAPPGAGSTALTIIPISVPMTAKHEEYPPLTQQAKCVLMKTMKVMEELRPY